MSCHFAYVPNNYILEMTFCEEIKTDSDRITELEKKI